MSRESSKKNEKGLTLVEVIISTLVIGIIGGMLLMILVNNAGIFYQQSARVSQGLGLNDALGSIRSIIKEGQSVALGYPEGSSPTYTTSASTLVLKLPSVDSSGNVITNVFDYVVIVVEQENLKFRVFPDELSTRIMEDKILAFNVESILFQYYDAGGLPISPVSAIEIKTTLKLRQKAGSYYETEIATSEAQLRND